MLLTRHKWLERNHLNYSVFFNSKCLKVLWQNFHQILGTGSPIITQLIVNMELLLNQLRVRMEFMPFQWGSTLFSLRNAFNFSFISYFLNRRMLEYISMVSKILNLSLANKNSSSSSCIWVKTEINLSLYILTLLYKYLLHDLRPSMLC